MLGFSMRAWRMSRPRRTRLSLLFSTAVQARSNHIATSVHPPPLPARWPGSLVTLAIETSCDDTCVAVLEKAGVRARLLFEERITADNRAFGGIHPLTATVSHTAVLAPLVQRAVAHSGLDKKLPDFVAATRGPGMASSLATGLAVAKGLAVAWGVPLVGVHHMQAHALTPRLVAAMGLEGEPVSATPAFPYLSLLVSGGHTLLVHSRSLADHHIIAAADNIAIGDLLDKCARAILPAGYIAAAETAAGRSLPYGALLEGFAGSNEEDYIYPQKRRDEMAPFESGRGWRLEAPLGNGALRKALRFDFSGLNGAVIKLGEQFGSESSDGSTALEQSMDADKKLLARGAMRLAFEHLASRLLLAFESGAVDSTTPSCLVVAGGVASNRFLRRVLRSALDVRGFGHLPLVVPPAYLCTDNAAMIAWAGMEMFKAGWQTSLDVLPLRRWSMDEGGILGASGWRREPET